MLCADDRFCAELGRAVLAAERLESALKRYLAANAPSEDTTKATLGKLIQYSKKHTLLTRMVPVLEMLRDQRNYLTHNIHTLLSDLIGETILERANLFRCRHVYRASMGAEQPQRTRENRRERRMTHNWRVNLTDPASTRPHLRFMLCSNARERTGQVAIASHSNVDGYH